MIKNLSQKIEKLFDQNQEPFSLDELKKSFQLSPDNKQIENLSYIFEKNLDKKDSALLFSQLSSFFEIGFLFEKTNRRKDQATQMFAYSTQIKNLDGLNMIQLPRPELFKILQTSTESFLKKINLSQYGKDEKLQTFLIRVSQTETLVLLSSLAGPWGKLRLQSLQNTLMKIHFE